VGGLRKGNKYWRRGAVPGTGLKKCWKAPLRPAPWRILWSKKTQGPGKGEAGIDKKGKRRQGNAGESRP